MTPCYIGLGSNLEEPIRQLRAAVAAISALPDSRLVSVSGAYRSAAVGPGVQPDYLNAVLRLDTALAPESLLDRLQAIEHRQGRVRSERWGARTLDLDILLFGDLTLATPRLTVPHPRLCKRDFVLHPLAEIAGRNLLLPDGAELDTVIARCPRGDLQRTDLPLVRQASGTGDGN